MTLSIKKYRLSDQDIDAEVDMSMARGPRLDTIMWGGYLFSIRDDYYSEEYGPSVQDGYVYKYVPEFESALAAEPGTLIR